MTEIGERRLHWFVVSEEFRIETSVSDAMVANTWTYSGGT